MTDSVYNAPRNRKPPQKPVFIIDPFDASNSEHMRGNMKLVFNSKFATDLCRLIRECELTKDEGYIYAIQGNIKRWYTDRHKAIMKSKEAETKIE